MRTPPAISGPTRASVFRLRASVGAFLLVGIAAAGGGCAKARAEANPAGPPLSIPAPPPRALMPVEAEPIAAIPAPEPPIAAAPRVTPTPLPTRRPPATRTEPETRTEAPAATATPVAGATEPRELRTVPSSPGASSGEASVKNYLTRAELARSNVTYSKLSAEGRKNFDESKRHSDLALEKLKEGNILLARSAAEKAATLAEALSN